MLKDFKTFLLRGNVVDLAVAVVVGAAFGAVVTAFVRDLLTPIIALIFGKPNFSNLSFTVNSSHFLYGDFLNYLFAFVTVAAAVFFLVVQPTNALMRRHKTEPDVESETRPCSECLSDIPKPAAQVRLLRFTPGGQPGLGLTSAAAALMVGHRLRFAAADPPRPQSDGPPRVPRRAAPAEAPQDLRP